MPARPIVAIALASVLTSALPLPPLSAQEPPSIGLDRALQLFAENNIELRVARLRADEAAGLARQAGAFPNPVLNASHEPLSGASRSYSETYLTASQRFEVSGARGARANVFERRADGAVLAYRSDSLRIAFEVKKTYMEAVLAQEQEAASQRVATVFRQASTRARERYADGDIARFTLSRIEVEHARYERILADAEIQLGSAQRALALLVAPSGSDARIAAAGLTSLTPPATPGGVGVADALARRPEVAVARSAADAEGARVRLVRAERVPDLTATAGFKRQSDGLRGGFFGLSFPVPLFDRGAAATAAAGSGLRAAEERVELVVRQIENDVLRSEEAYRALTARSALLGGEDAADAGTLLEIALVAYEEGEMDLLDLLDAAEAAHGAIIARSRLQADLWIAYFDLERALGGFDELRGEEAP